MHSKTNGTLIHPDSVPLTLGGRMRAARHARAMSQDQVAQPQFTKSYVSAVERDKARPSVKALRLMAVRLGTTAAVLLTEPADAPAGAAPEQRAVEILDQAALHLYQGEAWPAAAILDPGGWDLPALPEPLQVRYLDLRSRAQWATGHSGAAHELLRAGLARLAADTRSLRITLAATTAGYDPTGALAAYAACQAELATDPTPNLGLILRLAVLQVAAYTCLQDDAGVLEVAETVMPLVRDGLPVERFAALCPPSVGPPLGADGPAAPRLALYAVVAARIDAATVLTAAAPAACRRPQSTAGTPAGYLRLARLCLAGLRQEELEGRIDLEWAAIELDREGGDLTAAESLINLAQVRLAAVTAENPTGRPQLGADMARAYCLLGQLRERQGDPSAADECFTQALAQARQSHPAMVRQVAQHYGDLLHRRGEATAASTYYRLALLPDTAPELQATA